MQTQIDFDTKTADFPAVKEAAKAADAAMRYYRSMMPSASARAVGEEAAARCLEKAERDTGFDSTGAARFILGWVVRHGATSGEDLVDAAMEHGYRGHDMRCFGGVFGALVRTRKLLVLRSDLPRKRGHGTSGGRLYGLVR